MSRDEPASDRTGAEPGYSVASRSLRGVIQRLQPDWVYLSFALLFGAAFLVLTPPFQVPDEEAHLRRAFEISDGRIIARKTENGTGDDLPQGMESFYLRFKLLKGRPEEKTTASEIIDAAAIPCDGERQFTVFSNSAIHPPLTYLPQAFGLFVARFFTSSVVKCFYGGRAANLLAAILTTFFAIRITPVGKWAFAVLALTPMTLTLDASLSPDALTNAFSFLFVGQVLNCAQLAGQEISWRRLTMLALSAAAVGLSKQTYFLLPLSYLLIPIGDHSTTRRYWTGFALVMGATFVAVLGWGLIVRQIWSPADPKIGMDPARQFQRMRSDPAEFARVLLETAKATPVHVEEYLGKLGWAELQLPRWIIIVEFCLLTAVCLWDFGPRSGLTTRQAVVAAVVALLVSFTVLVIMHLTWDNVGSTYISLHGRYFIPIGPLIGIVLGRLSFLIPGTLAKLTLALPPILTLSIPLLLALSLVRVYERFYVDSAHDAAERSYVRAREFVGAALVERKAGHEERARVAEKEALAAFQESLKIDPSHFASHFWLGLLLRETHPREAEEQFRATLHGTPDDNKAQFELAKLLAQRGEFAEAVHYFELAVQHSPENKGAVNGLNTARSQLEMQERLRPLEQEFLAQVQTGMSEPRHQGKPDEGLFLLPNRKSVLPLANQPGLTKIQFLWRSPPPSGRDIRIYNRDNSREAERGDSPFYACSTGFVAGQRVFIFSPGAKVRLLADNQVSWFHQVPLAALSEPERQQEEAFRRRHDMHFPLARLPEMNE